MHCFTPTALAQLPRGWSSHHPWRCPSTMEMWHLGTRPGWGCESCFPSCDSIVGHTQAVRAPTPSSPQHENGRKTETGWQQESVRGPSLLHRPDTDLPPSFHQTLPSATPVSTQMPCITATPHMHSAPHAEAESWRGWRSAGAIPIARKRESGEGGTLLTLSMQGQEISLAVFFWQPNQAKNIQEKRILKASEASGNFQNVLDKNDLLEVIHKSSK